MVVGQLTWYQCSKPKQRTLVYFLHSCIALGGSKAFLPVWGCFRQNGHCWCPPWYLKGSQVSQLDLWWCMMSLWSVLGSLGPSQGIIRWTRWIQPVGVWTGPPSDYLGQRCFSSNFGLRLNFAVADYLSETLRCNNMTSHWGQVVGEPWALLFSKKKAKIWCKNSQKILFWHCFPTIKLTLGAYFNIYMYKFGTSSLISP